MNKILERIKNLFSPPNFPEDEEKTRLARIMHVILLGMLIFLGPLYLFLPNNSLIERLIPIFLVVVMATLLYALHKGQTQVVSIIIPLIGVAAGTFFISDVGVYDIGLLAFPISLVLAGLLNGKRGALIIGAISVIIFGLLITAEINGWIPGISSNNPGYADIGLVIVLYGILMLSVYVLVDNLTISIQQARKNSNELQASEGRLRIVFDALPASVLVVDQENGNVSFANAQLAESFGVSLDKLVGSSAASLFYRPSDLSTILALFRQQGYLQGYDVLGKRINNEPFWASVTIQSINFEGVPSYLVSFEDITKRKQAEEQLSAFRSMSENAVDGITMLDFDGKILYANRAAYKMAGYDSISGELLGNPFGILIPETGQRQWLDEILVKSKTTGWTGEVKLSRIDGSEFDGLLSFFPVLDAEKKMIAVASIIRDISESKSAQAEILASQQRLALLVESSPLAVIEWDMELHVVTWNPAAERIFGYDYQEAIGKSASELLLRIDSGKNSLELWTEALMGGHKGRTTFDNRTKDGRIITCEWYNTPLVSDDGNMLGVASLAIDITERQLLEQQVQFLLDRRGYQVQISTQIAQEIASAPALDDLFKRVVTLVKENLGYYHAQILRYDSLEDAVLLLTGYGEVGAKMLQAGHRMPMGIGLIGTAAATGKTMLRSDLAQGDPNWRPNPLLPNTKGEIAVPIKLGEQILGVLDVQSDQAGGLTEDDQLLLEGMCGQIAIAIEQTRLRQEMQERLEEIHALYRTTSREGWQSYQEQTHLPEGFVFEQSGVAPVSREWEDALQKAISENRITQNVDGQPIVALPVSVPGGEIIGALGMYDDPNNPVSSEDIDFVQQVSEQIALALESARLFNQTQFALAETDTLYTIISELNAARDYSEILSVLDKHTILSGAHESLILCVYDKPLGEGMVPEWVIPVAQRTSTPVRLAERYPLSAFETLPNTLFTKTPVVIKDISTDGRMDRITRTLFQEVFQATSTIIIPLLLGDQSSGFIMGNYGEIQEYPEVEIQRLSSIANQVALAVQGLRLLEQTLARARREQLLREVSAQVNNAIDTDHILRQAAEQVGRVLKRPVYVYLSGRSGDISNDAVYTKAGEDELDEFIR